MTPHLRRAAMAVVVALLGVALVQPGLAASAVSTRPVVKAKAPRSVVLAGDKVKITGTAAPGKKGDVVKVQRHEPHRWKTVATSKLTSSRKFSLAVRPKAGTSKYRVVRVAGSSGRRATSKSVVVKAKPQIAVSASASTSSVMTGQSLRVSGKVSPARAGDVVKVQRKDGSLWQTLEFQRLTAARAYAFTVKPRAGTVQYRVVRAETSTGGRGTSRTVTVGSQSCAAMPRPARSMVAWSTNPTVAGTSSMAVNLGHLFCAVAPGATVRVAMFLLNSDSESEVILGALEKMHRYKGVKVEVLLEGTPYTDPISPKTGQRLASFATLRLCQKSCRSEIPGVGNMHQKFVTINDMAWAAGKDPALWTSSANWNKRQLRDYWQTGILVYGDRRLVSEFDARYESMRACGSSGGCASWKPAVFGKLLSAAYELISNKRVWSDAGFDWRTGDAGGGTKMIFSPVRPGIDPVISELARYSCTPQHRTVRLAIYRTSDHRGAAISQALGELRARGCDVRAVLSVGGAEPWGLAGASQLRGQGVATTCVNLMHDKFGYFDVVDRSSGAVRKVLWTASQNFTDVGITANDEVMISMTAESADSRRASDIRAMASTYYGRWGQMARHPVACAS